MKVGITGTKISLQDVGGSAADFGYVSGKYSMDLIVGDAVVENPFSWTLVSSLASIANLLHCAGP